MTQEREVHVPQIITQERNHHFHVEEVVDVHVPQEQEELVHVPQVQRQERTLHNPVEMVVEVPHPEVHERTVEVPVIEIEEKTVKVPKVHARTLHSTHNHQVQTIEVEKPKIVHKTVRRVRPVVHGQIVHVPREVPQV